MFVILKPSKEPDDEAIDNYSSNPRFSVFIGAMVQEGRSWYTKPPCREEKRHNLMFMLIILNSRITKNGAG
jgi:hypothetical protein